MIYLLDFRSSDTGGAVVPGRVVTAPGLGSEPQLRGETSVTFIVHGYNVSRTAGRESLVRASQLLSVGHPVAYVGVLWPGDHWSRAASYPFEGRDADDTAAALVKYIHDVLAPGCELSFASHSLGARVVLGAVKRLRASYSVAQTVLLAPAIDDSSVAYPADYLDAVLRARRVAVLASKKDRVLSLAYPAGDLLQAFIFFKTDRIGLALGFHGPRRSRTNAVPAQVYHEQIPDARASDHGHYLPDEPATQNQTSAMNFARQVLQGALQPRYQ